MSSVQQKSEAKVYVGVYTYTTPDGKILPIALRWPDGHRYMIDEVRDVQAASSRKAGGAGLRYTIRVGERITYLWQEPAIGQIKTAQGDYLWFVERR